MLKRMNAKQQETGMDYLDMAQSVQALGDSSMNITLRCAPPPATHRLLRLCTSCHAAPPATLRNCDPAPPAPPPLHPPPFRTSAPPRLHPIRTSAPPHLPASVHRPSLVAFAEGSHELAGIEHELSAGLA